MMLLGWSSHLEKLFQSLSVEPGSWVGALASTSPGARGLSAATCWQRGDGALSHQAEPELRGQGA